MAEAICDKVFTYTIKLGGTKETERILQRICRGAANLSYRSMSIIYQVDTFTNPTEVPPPFHVYNFKHSESF